MKYPEKLFAIIVEINLKIRSCDAAAAAIFSRNRNDS